MIKKICRFTSLASIVFLVASNSASQNPAMQVAKKQERNTLSIALEFSKKNRNTAERALAVLIEAGPNAYASGFLVGDGLVMTAYHVVSGGLSLAKRKILGFKPDDELQVKAYVNGCSAKIVKVDKDADLALLAVCASSKSAKRPTFQIDPTVDEPIILIARPRDNKFLRKGSFQGPYMFQGKEYWSIKVDALDGFSGSPVYNDQGHVVGVFCGYDSNEGVAFISPSAKAQKFLEEYDAGVVSNP